MKTIFKSFIFATVFLFPVLFFNCAEEQIPAVAQFSLIRQNLQLQTTSVSFGYNSNLTQTISVTGLNTPWTLTGLPDWLTASSTSGNGAATITLTAKENTSVDEARAAVLTFASTARDYQYSKTIQVSQPVATIYINPSESALSCLPKGETKTVNIESNVDWTATCSESWVTTKKASDTQLQITIAENLGQTRTATIHLMRSGTTTTINTFTVTQAEAGVTGSTDNIAFDVDGETKTTTFNAEASWTVSVSDDTWLSIATASGSAGSATISITAKANTSATARSGFAYVKIGSNTKLAIPVSQDGVKFTVSSSTLTLKSTKESATVNVTANAIWKVISKPEWLDVKLPETLMGTNVLTLTSQDNPNTTPRTGQLVIGREGFSGNQTVTVTQEGKTFDNLTEQMDFPITAATQALTIETDGTWTAATATSWIHLSPSSGQGRGTLQVSVDANPGKDERTGAITVTVGQTTQTIVVKQVGRYISLSCDDLITKSTPTTVQLTVSSNMLWTAASNVDWMTLEPKQGEGNAALTVSFADNPSINPRTGTITVESGEVTQAFSFTQPGRSLALNISTEYPITMSAGGGVTSAITITTDGTYEIKVSESWLAATKKGNTFTITAARSNSINQRRGTVTVRLTDLTGEEQLERVITVLQDPLTLTVNPTAVSFTYDGGTSEVITVTTTGNYTVTPSATWLTIKQTDKTFTITAAQNDGAVRTATVDVALTGLKSGESLAKTVVVTQKKIVQPDPLGLCPDDDHPHAIDMGLTVNGKVVKFACCNVGAETETNSQVQYGDYFAWGETTGYNSGKTNFSWSTYKWCRGSSDTMTKYCNSSSYGTVDNKTQLELSDDAARVNWGGSWRMSTIDELNALNNTYNFTWTWTTISDKSGYKVTSKSTKNSIFLPAAGYRQGSILNNHAIYGYYWSSLLSTSDAWNARSFYFDSSDHNAYYFNRFRGHSVRPVTE